MKHPLLTLLALAILLVPWLLLVTLGDWVGVQLGRIRAARRC